LIAALDGSPVPLGVYAFVLVASTFGTSFISPETQGREIRSGSRRNALDAARERVLDPR
jgi:hypothetical protein